MIFAICRFFDRTGTFLSKESDLGAQGDVFMILRLARRFLEIVSRVMQPGAYGN